MQHLESLINFINNNSNSANGAQTSDFLCVIAWILLIVATLAFVFCILKWKHHNLNESSTLIQQNSKYITNEKVLKNKIAFAVISLLAVGLCAAFILAGINLQDANAAQNEITITPTINANIHEENDKLVIDNATISNNTTFDYHIDKISLYSTCEMTSDSNWKISIDNKVFYDSAVNDEHQINPQIIIPANSSLAVFIQTDMSISEFSKYSNTSPLKITIDAFMLGKISSLKTDNTDTPNNIDNKNPVFSWTVENKALGAKTPAYQIIVKDENNNTVWDTSKQTDISNIKTSVKYAGCPLLSSTEYIWILTLWDNYDVQLQQKSSSFTTALLDDKPMQDAQYIGYKDPRLSDPNNRMTRDFTISYNMQIVQQEMRFAFSMIDSKNFWYIHFKPQSKASEQNNEFLDNFGFNIGRVNNGSDSENQEFNEILSNGFSNTIQNQNIKVIIQSKKDLNNALTNIISISLKNENDETIGKSINIQIGGDLENAIYLNKIGFYTFIRPAKKDSYTPSYKTKITNIKITNDSSTNTDKTVYSNNFSNGRLGFYHEYTADIENIDNTNWLVLGNTPNDCNWVHEPLEEENEQGCLPVVRTTFSTNTAKQIKKAYLYTSGLGAYDCFINGERSADNGNIYELKNGYTQIENTQLYLTQDITAQIKNGNNAISAVLSDGWWSDKVVNYMYGKDAFKCKLLIKYTDGSTLCICTNSESWKTKAASPVIKADILAGESYNANIDTSWKNVNFAEDTTWAKAQNCDGLFKGTLRSSSEDRIQVRNDLQRNPIESYTYKGAEKVKDGYYGTIANKKNFTGAVNLHKGESAIIDFGQNASGWENFTVSSNIDTIINIKHTEVLNEGNGEILRANSGPEGSANTTNLRGCKAITQYITKAGTQTYHPTLSFYGFRYIEITATQDITLSNIYASTITSVKNDTATFTSSSNAINKLFENGKWGMYSNFISIPTDCPQRDERQGWTGDAQIFAETAMYLADNEEFFEKYCKDIVDAQIRYSDSKNFAYPACAPFTGLGANGWGAAGWADAGIIIPYYMYKMYGNTNIVLQNWSSMEKYIKQWIPSIDCDEGSGKMPHRGPDLGFGDWHTLDDAKFNSDEIKNIIATEYYLLDLKIMGELAQATNMNATTVQYYNDKYNEIKIWFDKHFIDDNGGFKNNISQTVLCSALAFDILTKDQKSVVKTQLEENIKSNNYLMQTGFLGTKEIVDALGSVDDYDYAYKLLCQTSYPSWLYPVNHNATTFWEWWNSYTPETGYNPAYSKKKIEITNSFNHYSFGAVNAVLFKHLLGINVSQTAPAFKSIVLKPYPCTEITNGIDLRNVSGSFDSKQGKISVGSDYKGDKWIYSFTTPANTSTKLTMPKLNFSNFIVNGKSINELNFSEDGIEVDSQEGKYITFNVDSGSFSIVFSN